MEAFDSYYCNSWAGFNTNLASNIASGKVPLSQMNELDNTRQIMKYFFNATYVAFEKQVVPYLNSMAEFKLKVAMDQYSKKTRLNLSALATAVDNKNPTTITGDEEENVRFYGNWITSMVSNFNTGASDPMAHAHVESQAYWNSPQGQAIQQDSFRNSPIGMAASNVDYALDRFGQLSGIAGQTFATDMRQVAHNLNNAYNNNVQLSTNGGVAMPGVQHLPSQIQGVGGVLGTAAHGLWDTYNTRQHQFDSIYGRHSAAANIAGMVWTIGDVAGVSHVDQFIHGRSNQPHNFGQSLSSEERAQSAGHALSSLFTLGVSYGAGRMVTSGVNRGMNAGYISGASANSLRQSAGVTNQTFSNAVVPGVNNPNPPAPGETVTSGSTW
jgi:hypothetical protein